MKGKGPSLLGRDWLRTLKLHWSSIHRLKGEEQLLGLLNKYTDVFAPGLGKLKDCQIDLHMDAQVQPWFYKARSVPYALKAKVEAELERPQTEGIIV